LHQIFALYEFLEVKRERSVCLKCGGAGDGLK